MNSYTIAIETTSYPDGLALIFNGKKIKFTSKFSGIVILRTIALIVSESIDDNPKFMFLHDTINRSELPFGRTDRTVLSAQQLLIQNLIPEAVYTTLHHEGELYTLESSRPEIEISGNRTATIGCELRMMKIKLPCGKILHMQSYSEIKRVYEIAVYKNLMTVSEAEHLEVLSEQYLPIFCPFLN